MKELTGLLLMLVLALGVSGQYYYKDVIVTRQTNAKWSLYRANKVKSVKVSSFEANGKPVEGFDCRQTVSVNFAEIRTNTLSNVSTASLLIASYDAKGYIEKTVDTSDTYLSTTEYTYDGEGHVLMINNSSVETDTHIKNTENHIWTYDQQGHPISMLKIRNSSDTTYVLFVADENGNIAEEHPIRHGVELPKIFYYYDNNHFLTDIVRFNAKANRLLPDYIFEPDAKGINHSMLYVPAGSNEYQQWEYLYEDNGLRQLEACYNKKKALLGKIEYTYEYFK